MRAAVSAASAREQTPDAKRSGPLGGPAEVGPAAGDLDAGFVDEPPIAHQMSARAGGLDELRRERLHPAVHGHVIDGDAALCEQLLDIALGQQPVASAGLPASHRGDRAPARHVTDQYANNSIEADHGRLKARLRPMRGLRQHRSLQTIAAGHAFLQNLRRGHYELGVDERANDRIRIAFTELAASL